MSINSIPASPLQLSRTRSCTRTGLSQSATRLISPMRMKARIMWSRSRNQRSMQPSSFPKVCGFFPIHVSTWSPINFLCAEFLGEMMDLCSSHRGQDMDHRYLELAGAAGVDSAPRVILTAKLPLSEVVTDFFDSLKHRSSGYASFECVLFLEIRPIFFNSFIAVMKMLDMKLAI